jgi:hypothetical protein
MCPPAYHSASHSQQMKRGEYETGQVDLANRRHQFRLSARITGQPFGFFLKGQLSRNCDA